MEPQLQPSPVSPTMPVSRPESYSIQAFTLKRVALAALVLVTYIAILTAAQLLLASSENILLSIFIGPILMFAASIVAIVLASLNISLIKNKLPEAPSSSDEKKAIGLMIISPIIVQAIYYFGLRRANKMIAQAFSNLGWKVIALQIVLGFIIGQGLKLVLPNS